MDLGALVYIGLFVPIPVHTYVSKCEVKGTWRGCWQRGTRPLAPSPATSTPCSPSSSSLSCSGYSGGLRRSISLTDLFQTPSAQKCSVVLYILHTVFLHLRSFGLVYLSYTIPAAKNHYTTTSLIQWLILYSIETRIISLAVTDTEYHFFSLCIFPASIYVYIVHNMYLCVYVCLAELLALDSIQNSDKPERAKKTSIPLCFLVQFF